MRINHISKILKVGLFAALFIVFSLPALAQGGGDDAFAKGRDAYLNKQWFAALNILRPLAERGDSRAIVLVANMYNDGSGVMRNRARAMNMYRDAAQMHNAEAMIAIAAMYQSGQVVKKNAKMASAWFHRAALLGNQAGAFFYAISKFQGDLSGATDLTQDVAEAYKWFLIASRIEGGYAHMRQAAQMTAASISSRLPVKERVAANRTVVAWRPVPPQRLGPLPDNPDSPLLDEIRKAVEQQDKDAQRHQSLLAPKTGGTAEESPAAEEEEPTLPPLQNVTVPTGEDFPSGQ